MFFSRMCCAGFAFYRVSSFSFLLLWGGGGGGGGGGAKK